MEINEIVKLYSYFLNQFSLISTISHSSDEIDELIYLI